MSVEYASLKATSVSDGPKKARVAVVGCGSWTQGWHLPNLSNRLMDWIAALVPIRRAAGHRRLRAVTVMQTDGRNLGEVWRATLRIG